ncbi:hypothetical protein RhiirA5_355309 [Rhizophagus irregularis]|uniref:Crinkler effector protein N-terminal domain-containing protein n=2 Tax=Rhizophagus irregularis TaxID=588596 RepID=U9TLY4_RHIID|nr:hypothetical protein GLOIN_2v1695635 [Rhizophagus irregularis DAOM 181602=DAOM 197198]PKC10580.1 hypothetical protein RhiirA5_355309 [Rhizophagus irregularis]PKC62225.1 hypothetical protein RhiirA1_424070 [Rhizophagus irregularis]PKY21165.1 hypothetical protein RhiirB3_409175 [Rhizophagus irregularis]POG62487.1 hypothetical protein GLOIN_2v1695635 [Rhizophagus irregularis DAOM 181602=DAOM 197198]UZO22069.1 hypothetical protein OCT59_014441 [Rhizophagus irregularis]|eukprot:XP_025169353.1 hypothetical protein GLOIN_2v1695635 [Rhizophagus irregularis DAOM 181602=DAOM 197198]
MSEVTILCFLQGIDGPFNVTVGKDDTIERLKKLILVRSEKSIATDEFRIWKVSVPADNIVGLQKVPAEVLDFVELLDNEKTVSDAVKIIRKDVIQVYMGKNVTSLRDELRELKALVHAQIQAQAQMCENIRILTDRLNCVKFSGTDSEVGNVTTGKSSSFSPPRKASKQPSGTLLRKLCEKKKIQIGDTLRYEKDGKSYDFRVIKIDRSNKPLFSCTYNDQKYEESNGDLEPLLRNALSKFTGQTVLYLRDVYDNTYLIRDNQEIGSLKTIKAELGS